MLLLLSFVWPIVKSYTTGRHLGIEENAYKNKMKEWA